METMRAPTVGSWDERPVDEYVRVCHEVTMLESRAAELLGQIDAGGGYEDAGYLSTTAFVRHRLGVSGGEASRRVGEARALRQRPGIREAYASAQIDRPRVSLLLAASKISDESFERDQQFLVDTISGLSMNDARRAIDYWKQAADQQATVADAEHLHRRRHLHVSETLGGMVRIDGELDPEGGQIVLTALRSFTDSQQRDSTDDRLPAQRRADALIEMAADHLAHADTPATGATRPQLSVIVSLQALSGAADAPCEFDDGAVITPETARRIACDSSVSRVITDGDSQILDVGRATRTIPSGIRKALIIRDQHCRHPGCDRPHRWCDAHHLKHWADGGPTNLDNLILLCRRHHRATHEGEIKPPILE
jgi:hypothetical protein